MEVQSMSNGTIDKVTTILRFVTCESCGYPRDPRYKHDPGFECLINQGLTAAIAIADKECPDEKRQALFWNSIFHKEMDRSASGLREFSKGYRCYKCNAYPLEAAKPVQGFGRMCQDCVNAGRYPHSAGEEF